MPHSNAGPSSTRLALRQEAGTIATCIETISQETRQICASHRLTLLTSPAAHTLPSPGKTPARLAPPRKRCYHRNTSTNNVASSSPHATASPFPPPQTPQRSSHSFIAVDQLRMFERSWPRHCTPDQVNIAVYLIPPVHPHMLKARLLLTRGADSARDVTSIPRSQTQAFT
ncbi:hypothetical protein GWK47_037950 [Chionoecetes opilio]|uniref:Uncharacterized protein n=1 Tax=Chionoecetes opilio TaxID=41210 RepID=A0A8J4YS87_CHIOP|nr:hypothetical protein GWK47_037950 [Chionoecetes opilio]